MMTNKLMRVVPLLVALPMQVACGESDDAATPGQSLPENTPALIENYSAIVHQSYKDAHQSGVALDDAVVLFTATPSDASQKNAQDAWIASREPYLQTEVYRFYEGPIDDADSGPEGLINAWPLDEAYIDYVDGDANAGIVNDTTVTIDGATLESLNEQGGEKNIATGYHAIEFLLWGQDRSDNGPGDRPFTDFAAGGTAANQDRRGNYLTTSSSLLVGHLSDLVAAWEPGASNYRQSFTSADPKDALSRILTGMIVLSGFETGGERLQTALDSGEQEDEHSCFSDNTHRDMVQDVRGIQNVYRGQYTALDGSKIEGVGVRDVVNAVDAELAKRLDDEIADSLSKAEALQPPFDQEIKPGNDAGRARVQTLVIALRKQADTLEEVFRRFGLNVPVVE